MGIQQNNVFLKLHAALIVVCFLCINMLAAYDHSFGYIKPAAHNLKSVNYSVSEAKVGASLGFSMSADYTTYTLLSDIESIAPSVPGTLNNVPWTNLQPGTYDFADATDNLGGSGIDGYHIYWDTDPNGTSPAIWSKVSSYNAPVLTSSNVYYLRAQTQDNAGNVSPWNTVMYYQYDQDLPIISDVPHAIQTYVSANPVVFNWLSAIDIGGSGVRDYYYEVRATATVLDSGWVTTNYALFTGEQGVSYSCRIFARDVAGNISAFTPWGPEVIVDSFVPTGDFTINGGAEFTDDVLVLLDLHVTDPVGIVPDVLISNDGIAWTLVSYNVTLNWTLISGDGLKDVAVRFIDGAGNISDPVTHSIYLDTHIPALASIMINDNAIYTNNYNVLLRMYVDSVQMVSNSKGFMRFAEDGSAFGAWERYMITRNWTLAPGEGLRTMNVQFMDELGTIQPSVTANIYDAIIVDVTPPSGSVEVTGDIMIREDGKKVTNKAVVDLALAAIDNLSGVDGYLISNDGLTWTYRPWTGTIVMQNEITYDLQKLLLTSEFGTKLLSVRYVDRAGNISQIYTQDVIYDAGSRIVTETGAVPTIFDPDKQDTRIYFNVKETGSVKVTIYDLSGIAMWSREDEVTVIGSKYVIWDGSSKYTSKLGNGVYIFYITEGRNKKVIGRGKVILMREDN